MRILLLCLGFFGLVTSSLAQTSAWTPVTMPLTKDTISLEDMTGATAASFNASAHNATALLDFPSGFNFQLGLTKYDKFSISAYGYIKLGGVPFHINPTLQDTIISAMYAFPSTYTTCSYKLSGTAPNRKLTIEWNGTLLGSGPTKFQLWLYERIGRIQFVYNTVKKYSTGNGYAIFLKTKIFDAPAIVSVKTNPNDAPPTARYNIIDADNYDSIYAKSRFTFQPDTIKPVRPGNFGFENVLAGCFDVVVSDSSVNESVFHIEKIDTGPWRLLKNIFSTTGPTVGEVYSHSETRMQPDSLYQYRAFASTGFVNSDTVYKSIRTPMPMINGTKSIPGDYTSITALLNDADCKHLGPNLVIELQNSYSYSLEPAPVRFKRNLQTKVLRNVTIRPAAGANLVLTSNAVAPLFTIDSVKFIGFDGRPGGLGTNIGLTIRQQDTTRPAISYVHHADSGFVQYCNIEGRSRNGYFGLIYMGFRDNSWFNNPPGVNGAIIRNCKIGPAAGQTTDRTIVIDNNGRGDSITIEGNEFYRFKDAAIYSFFAGTGVRISKNRFYQPEQIAGNTAALHAVDTRGNWVVDSNRIGGSTSAWGVGKWSSYGFFNNISLINCTSTYPGNSFTVRGNQFGNISLTGGTLQMMHLGNTKADIVGNRIGTTDSTNSIVSESHNYAISLAGWGTKTVSQNFFSGMQADYPDQDGGQDLVMITAFFMDSMILKNNDFGGSDNRYQNYTGGQARCISVGGIKNAIITNNEIHGITSRYKHAFGIEEEWAGVSPTEKSMIADSNRIHHLQGRLTVYGIYSRVYSAKTNRYNNNKIYSLRAIGPYAAIGASQPAFLGGIVVDHFPYPDNTSPIDTSLVWITNNDIHSLEYVTPADVYLYQMTGISGSATNVRINNNMVQLGIGANGLSTDSLELMILGIAGYGTRRTEIEHNSVYIGGAGEYSTGMDFSANNPSNGNKTTFLSNNIIKIDRRKAGAPNSSLFMPNPSGTLTSVASNYNIWHSTTDADINAKLAQWRTKCQCDSSTVIADPLFINPAGDSLNYNLHLQVSSPADSAGTPPVSAVNHDIDGQERLQYSPVDIGADAINPCPGNSPAIQLQITPANDVIEICTGGSFQLNASVSGGSVTGMQWQRNLNDIAGANGNTYMVTQAGSYRVTARLACGKIASRTVVIITGATPPVVDVVSLTPVPYCDSGRITLQATYTTNLPGAPVIRWYKNDVLQAGRTNTTETFDTIKVNDRYRVEMSQTIACGTLTGRDSVVIAATSASIRPKIQVIRYDTSRCNVNIDTIRYRITNSAFSLPVGVIFTSAAPGATWRTVGDSLVILENLPLSDVNFKLYTLPSIVLTCYFPDTTSEKTIIYVPNATPTATIVGNNIVSNSPVFNQWYSAPNTLIPGATSQTFTPSTSGTYFVRLIRGSCISAPSNMVNFVFTALPTVDPPKEELQLYPNPTDGKVWIKSELISGPVTLELRDINGRLIQTFQASLQRSTALPITLNAIQAGVYFLKVSTKETTYLFKVVVK